MHIVFVTVDLASIDNATNGQATFNANIAHIFKERGHRVSIILVTTKKLVPKVELGINLYPLHVPMKIWKRMDAVAGIISLGETKKRDIIRRTIVHKYKSKIVQKTIQKIHSKDPIDIIHCCHHIPLFRKYTKNIPYILRVSCLGNVWAGANMPEGKLSYTDNPVYGTDKLKERNIKSSRYIVTPSHLLADVIAENLGVKANVIESPFVLEQQNWDSSYLEQYDLKSRRYIIHYAGELRYFKGTHVVAGLAESLLQRYPDLYLILAGACDDMLDDKGNVVKAHELVKQKAGKYADRVIYVGHLVREQLYPLIRYAEVCLLPSRIENLAR